MENQAMLRQLVKYMEDHNIQDYGVELPQIAVMGDTSSGKSSLLSAISKIIFPSADGMCTRCPTRLRMERSEGFKASVHINWHPTSKCAERVSERSVLKDIAEITNAIEKAQKLIIDKTNRSVANDIIEINLAGPEYVNVTLVDLPGAFSQSRLPCPYWLSFYRFPGIVKFAGKGEKATLANDIDDVLEDFLKNDRCVILAVMPANVHFSNTEIMPRALKVDPSTRRIIPVVSSFP